MRLAKFIDRVEGDELRERGARLLDQHERLRPIATALQAERERRGMSLVEASRLSGIAEEDLVDLEAAKDASVFQLMEYAHALGKSLELRLE